MIAGKERIVKETSRGGTCCPFLLVAAGVLYPLGILLAPEVGALAMSASSITVATNAVLLKSVEKKLRA